ncbi:uncharacterized protein N7459_009671 [Penicillium hispanicum]|uniref:uncharacterized protein n=1 Tax=Penicillium hispanicum TaxID=1080232 RepID=UPI0025405712|nr:uncharacterized protein N7459_009671 [Penicillium hispanicum]KAJ5570241.1 hypothetical protein N7459_009671 [Penicillium hispanicum]
MDADETYQANLRAAIQASLRESNNHNGASPSRQPVVPHIVDLTNDSDHEDVQEIYPKSQSVIGSETEDEAEQDGDDGDEALNHAIAMSLQPQGASPQTEAPQVPSQNREALKPQGLLGLDRKQMEQERLARQTSKRKAEGSPTLSSPTKTARTEPAQSSQFIYFKPALEVPSLQTDMVRVHLPMSCEQPTANNDRVPVQPTARPVAQWLNGIVKKTNVRKAPRSGNDITIQEVIQRGDLELAVFSSYLWDMEWLFSNVDTRNTRFILVMSAKEESLRRQIEEETRSMPNIRLCFPPMDGQVNCMHSKLMLLFHPGYLRIVVPTANLTSTDWGENNLMENASQPTAFLIDLPKNREGSSPNIPKPQFYDDLVYFLKASTLHDNIIAKLDNFDFSSTARYAFVHTIGGTHSGESWKRTGYSGLGQGVNSMGLRSTAPINIDYVTSSVGSLTEEFLRAIYLACKGDDGLTDYTIRNTKPAAAAQSTDPTRTLMLQSSHEWRDRFQVYFPSDQTVHAAHDTPARTAGTICFQSKWWNGPKFPRQVLKDCESKRGVLMHNKLIFVRPAEPITLPNTTTCRGWAYVGSANLSESAWGRIVKDRATGQPKLNCRNWECGVLVPVTDGQDVKAASGSHGDEGVRAEADDELQSISSPSEIFRDIVPVPMKLPARSLGAGREPWFFMEG